MDLCHLCVVLLVAYTHLFSLSTNGASKPERQEIIDLARRNELTAMIIKKAGFEGESSQLQQCTEALLEFETRRFLWTRKPPVS